MKTRTYIHTYEPPKAEILTIAPQCVLCSSAFEGETSIEGTERFTEVDGLVFP